MRLSLKSGRRILYLGLSLGSSKKGRNMWIVRKELPIFLSAILSRKEQSLQNTFGAIT